MRRTAVWLTTLTLLAACVEIDIGAAAPPFSVVVESAPVRLAARPTTSNIVTATATVKDGGSGAPLAKVLVTFMVTKADGSTVSGTAATNRKGSATWQLMLVASDPIGVYSLTASVTVGGIHGSGTTTFSVK